QRGDAGDFPLFDLAVAARALGRRLRGLERGPRRLAPLLAGARPRVDVRAQPAIRRMPQRAFARELHVADLADQLRLAPVRRSGDTRRDRARGCLALAP